MDALIIRGSKEGSSSLSAHYRRGSLSCPSLLLWAQRKMTRCICSTAALPTHHRANSAMTTTNDDDHKHFLATTDSFPPSPPFSQIQESWIAEQEESNLRRHARLFFWVCHRSCCCSNEQWSALVFLNAMNPTPLPNNTPLSPKKKKAWHPIVLQH